MIYYSILSTIIYYEKAHTDWFHSWGYLVLSQNFTASSPGMMRCQNGRSRCVSPSPIYI